jgi:hypothetical protein
MTFGRRRSQPARVLDPAAGSPTTPERPNTTTAMDDPTMRFAGQKRRDEAGGLAGASLGVALISGRSHEWRNWQTRRI